LYNVKRVFEVADIIFNDQEILIHKDLFNIDLLGYFIEYATYDLIDEFIKALLKYRPKDQLRALLNNIDNKGRTHLIMICENKKFEDLDSTIKSFIDLILSCGIDYFTEIVTTSDYNGNNMLMAALKCHHQKIALKILDIISHNIIEHDALIKIEHKLMKQRDSEDRNILIILLEVQSEKRLLDTVIKIIKIIPSNWECLINDRHNIIMFGIANDNNAMINNAFAILVTMDKPSKTIILSDLCRRFDINNNNYISLCFKYSRFDLYMKLIEEIEETIDIEIIIKSFKETFAIHRDILYLALSSNKTDVLSSLMKYLRLINDISEDHKRYIAELIIRKNHNQSSLLSYATKQSNNKACQIIINTAEEFCDSIMLKILINSRDADGNTPYIIARLNNNERLAELLLEFANRTGNQPSIIGQIKDLKRIEYLQTSHIKPLVKMIFI